MSFCVLWELYPHKKVPDSQKPFSQESSHFFGAIFLPLMSLLNKYHKSTSQNGTYNVLSTVWPEKKSFSHFLVSILPIYYGLKSSFLDTFSNLVTDRVLPEIGFSGTRNQPKNRFKASWTRQKMKKSLVRLKNTFSDDSWYPKIRFRGCFLNISDFTK